MKLAVICNWFTETKQIRVLLQSRLLSRRWLSVLS